MSAFRLFISWKIWHFCVLDHGLDAILRCLQLLRELHELTPQSTVGVNTLAKSNADVGDDAGCLEVSLLKLHDPLCEVCRISGDAREYVPQYLSMLSEHPDAPLTQLLLRSVRPWRCRIAAKAIERAGTWRGRCAWRRRALGRPTASTATALHIEVGDLWLTRRGR